MVYQSYAAGGKQCDLTHGSLHEARLRYYDRRACVCRGSLKLSHRSNQNNVINHRKGKTAVFGWLEERQIDRHHCDALATGAY